MRCLWITYYKYGIKKVPMVTWLMKKDKVVKLHKLIQNIKTPIDYGSSLRSAFSANGKIIGCKTHDYHNFKKILISYYVFHILY